MSFDQRIRVDLVSDASQAHLTIIELPSGSGSKRSAHSLPRLEGPLAIASEHLSNAALFCTVTALGLVRLVGQQKHPHCWKRFASSRLGGVSPAAEQR